MTRRSQPTTSEQAGRVTQCSRVTEGGSRRLFGCAAFGGGLLDFLSKCGRDLEPASGMLALANFLHGLGRSQ